MPEPERPVAATSDDGARRTGGSHAACSGAPASRMPATMRAGCWPRRSACPARRCWPRPSARLGAAQSRQALRSYLGRRAAARAGVAHPRRAGVLRPHALPVSPATLDPRPDSETLIEAALGFVARGLACAAPAAHSRRRHRHRLPAARRCCASCPMRRGSAPTSARPRCRSHAPMRAASASRDRAAWRWRTRSKASTGLSISWSAIRPTCATADIAGLEPEVRDFDPRAGARWRQRRPRHVSPHGATARRRWFQMAGFVLRGRLRPGRRGCQICLHRRPTSRNSRRLSFHRDVAGMTTLCCCENTRLSICPESPWIFGSSAIVWGQWNCPRPLLSA